MSASTDPYQLLLAGYSGKVASYTFTPPSTLTLDAEVQGEAGKSPSWAAFSPSLPVAYVCDEDESKGMVHALGLPGLQKVGQATETDGKGPCSAIVVGHLLFVANYLTGSTSIHSLSPSDGSLLSTTLSRIIAFHRSPPGSTGPVSSRQDRSYAHQAIVDPSGRFVYIADLGADRVHRLKVPESGMADEVEVVDETEIEEGAGPRHLAFHCDSATGHTYAYLACELNTTLLAFHVDPKDGSLQPTGEAQSSLPPGLDAGGTPADGNARTTSEIAVSPCGRFVYVGTRGDPEEDHIAIFARRESGEVEWIGWDGVGGRNLRHFSLSTDGKWVAAASQNDGRVVMLRRDDQSGRLTKTGEASIDFEKVAFAGFVAAGR